MQDECNLYATDKIYKYHFRRWGLKKNLRRREVGQLCHKIHAQASTHHERSQRLAYTHNFSCTAPNNTWQAINPRGTPLANGGNHPSDSMTWIPRRLEGPDDLIMT
ncbi:uncharacterized protein BCR38DRAFT_152386 [Pseudomassariella vexata]|uniref:Clr5 domain-containing protein n=1 Tax=Pseudomassariella vexata TaxID=1141098 RepID=A0A1Y2E7A8_9PEZI|nr:uncharacterized protein BCR38DRAFT_152386 [Pseudomassariella vexata]ORY67166.1 hypothetical protein BCR38DRAFT_152386 [Pseudomassariella vexata]